MLDHLLAGDGMPRKAKKLLKSGQAAPAEIASIRVSARGTEPETDRWEYGLRVGGATQLLGVRQQLMPQRERAHLGAQVTIRHDGEGAAVIDWTASMATWGHDQVAPSAADWHMVGPPPEGTIEESRSGQRGTSSGADDLSRLEVTAVTRSEAMAGLAIAWDLTLRGEAGQLKTRATNVPAYAVHLLTAGTVLLGATGDQGASIDWARSAMAVAIAGRTTGFDFDANIPVPEADGTIGDVDEWMAEFKKFQS